MDAFRGKPRKRPVLMNEEVMNMKINQKNNTARRNPERRGSREALRRSGWTEFYTHNAVPAICALQECFKQEQR